MWPANEWNRLADGMASKRSRSSPTGLTPYQREKHQNRQECIESASAKKLSKLSFATNASWSAVEGCVLVKYVMDKEFVASWPQTKKKDRVLGECCQVLTVTRRLYKWQENK